MRLWSKEYCSTCRSLRNNRTRIHKNLFVAMLMQVVIRLTLYVDQGFSPPGRSVGSLSQHGFVHNTVSAAGHGRAGQELIALLRCYRVRADIGRA